MAESRKGMVFGVLGEGVKVGQESGKEIEEDSNSRLPFPDIAYITASRTKGAKVPCRNILSEIY